MARRLSELLKPEIREDEVLGVPLAAADPDSLKTTLAFDAYEILAGLDGLVRDLDQQVRLPHLMSLTKTRIERLRAAYAEHRKILDGLFGSLGHASLPFSELNQQLSRRRAGHMLVRHYEHLFRDWAWGQAEIGASIELTKRVMGSTKAEGRALVLGAGACRYPYELHRWLGLESTLCVDNNPLPLACARRLLAGEELELFEFPTMPRGMDAFAVRSRLRCPEPIGHGFELLVHDLEEWGLVEGSFDLVVTPWFIDVMPMHPRRLFALINRALAKGGLWLNFGPVGFNKRVLSQYFSREEVLFLVSDSSFELLSQECAAVPYFHNPSSAHWRTEHVTVFLARKQADCQVPAEPERGELPKWIEDTKEPIVATFDVVELKRSFGFCLDMLERISGGVSVADLAGALAKDHGLTPEQTEYVVAGTLLQWQEAARYNPMK